MVILYRDDLIHKPLLDLINRVLCDNNFHWESPTFGYSTVNRDYPTKKLLDTDSKAIDSPQMVHPLFINGKIHSAWYHIFENLLTNILNQAFPSVDFKWFIGRAKLNVTFKSHFSDGSYYNPPHIDPYLDEVYDLKDCGDKKHQINMLIYFGDSDGDTFFFKGYTFEKKLLKRISPKNGRVVMFNRDQLHASSPPLKSQNRFVLNVNLLSNISLNSI